MPYAMQFAATGEPEVLQKAECEVPQPQADEILLRQMAVGLNFIDVYHRRGLYPLAPPAVTGVEGAGVVEAVGEGVTHVRRGDRVAYGGAVGAYADLRLLPAWRAHKIPDGLSFEIAGSGMLRGLTVYMLLTRVYPVEAGMTILVHGAAGGLGSVLTRWAKSLGAEVIGQVSGTEKAMIARANGADHVLVGRDLDLENEVAALTGGKGVHLAINGIGGDTLTQTMACVRPFGMTVSVGQIAGAPLSLPFAALRSNALSRPSVMAFTTEKLRYEPAVTEVLRKMEEGVINGPSDRYALQDVVEAHHMLEAGRILGSAVLLP